MLANDRFGDVLQATLRLEEEPLIIHRTLGTSWISIIEGVKTSPDKVLSGSFPIEDSYIVNVPLSTYEGCENWEQGRYAATRNLVAGAACIADLKREPRFVIDRAFHAVHFRLPRSMFDMVADQSDARRIDELCYDIGTGYDDMVIRHLTGAARPALLDPDRANGLFVEHVAFALAAHLAHRYGNMRPRNPVVRGGLARWQEKRAYDLITANLAGGVSLQELAAECELSVSHFARAFRQTTGLPPHRWLLQRRLEVARNLMREGRHSLADIALASGFASQSHFTYVFKNQVGTTPGAWRRERATRSGHEDA